MEPSAAELPDLKSAPSMPPPTQATPPGRSGMGMGMGMESPFPKFRSTWYPMAIVRGQNAEFEMFQQDLSFACPLWGGASEGVALTGKVRSEVIQTDAILPDSGQPFPGELWNILVGTSYRRTYDNGWTSVVSLQVGSASDRPFQTFHEASATAFGMLRLPQGERDAWMLSLMFSTNSQILYNLPIPGISYFYNPSDAFQALVGLPFAMLRLRPWDDWSFEFSYAILTRVHSRALYEPMPAVRFYAGFDWLNENFQLADRQVDRERLFSYEKRVAGGVQIAPWKHLALDLMGGLAFDREYFQAERGFDLSGADRVGIRNGPFVSLQLEGKF